jgi:hypothetical protein
MKKTRSTTLFSSAFATNLLHYSLHVDEEHMNIEKSEIKEKIKQKLFKIIKIL